MNEAAKAESFHIIPGLQPEDIKRVADLDSRHFDYIDLTSPSGQHTLELIRKALEHYNAFLLKESERKDANAQPVSPAIFCRMGHLYLLVLEWEKALAAYQTYYVTSALSRKDAYFYYGLGLVYFNQECYLGAARAFHHAVYCDSAFSRSNEVLFRLGIIYKHLEAYDVALRSFKRTMNDPTPFTETKDMINFQIGHIYELQGRYEMAKKFYEQVLHSPTCDNQLKADVLRQLGWMFHTVEEFGERSQRVETAIKCLQKSLELDPNNGQTWYFMGRCYAVMSRVHDAFSAYRSSIDKSEANADTWCSIGTLYQQQNQPMDALQAYICALQLDKSHSPAWFDLGMLYESLKQYTDALSCYRNGIKYGKTAATPSLIQRAEVLEKAILTCPAGFEAMTRTIPSLEEALALPIAAELTSGHKPPQPTKRTSLLADLSEGPMMGAHELQLMTFLQQSEIQQQLQPAQQAILAKLQQQYMAQQQSGKPKNGFAAAAQTLKDRTFQFLPFSTNFQDDLAARIERINESVLKNSAAVLAECDGKDFAKLSPNELRLNLLNDDGTPPVPPGLPNAGSAKVNMNPPCPTMFVESKKEALNQSTEDFLLKHPCAMLKNLSNVLKLDLSLFSTKTLVETAPSQSIEVRTQRKQAPDDNLDQSGNEKTWKCESNRQYTTIKKHGHYQAEDFRRAIQEDAENRPISDSDSNMSSTIKKAKRTTLIRFGTNVDLSDPQVWRAQLVELEKLPPLVKVKHAKNMLTHLDHAVLGMNTVQLYIKVPGCRTPGHQENLNFCSVNINIGPGDCEWFCVAHEYWGVIQQLCEKNDVHYLHGSWWPSVSDLKSAGIPYYRFVQRPGDLVWINAGTVHWVQAMGYCNNIAWNVGPFNAEQYYLAVERYEWNKLQDFKSIVPMIHLTFAIAKNIVLDRKNEVMWKLVRMVLRRAIKYCHKMFEHLKATGKSVRYQARDKHEHAHYCEDCDVEVFNILFIKEREKDSYVVRCYECARKLDRELKGIHVLHQFKMKDLLDVYDNFRLAD